MYQAATGFFYWLEHSGFVVVPYGYNDNCWSDQTQKRRAFDRLCDRSGMLIRHGVLHGNASRGSSRRRHPTARAGRGWKGGSIGLALLGSAIVAACGPVAAAGATAGGHHDQSRRAGRRADSVTPGGICPSFVAFQGVQPYEGIIPVSAGSAVDLGLRLLRMSDPDTQISKISIEVFAPGTDIWGGGPTDPSLEHGDLAYVRGFDATSFPSAHVPAVFDGRDSGGRQLPPGIYPVGYRITVIEKPGASCLDGRPSPTLIEFGPLTKVRIT